MRALVTGAASGIGRATCLRIARNAAEAGGRAQVLAVDLRPSEGMDALLAELESIGAEGAAGYQDMGTVDGPAAAVAQAVDAFGGLDGLVSNAGINRIGPLLESQVAQAPVDVGRRRGRREAGQAEAAQGERGHREPDPEPRAGRRAARARQHAQPSCTSRSSSSSLRLVRDCFAAARMRWTVSSSIG